MIQVTRTGVTADTEQIAELRQVFAQQHCVVLPQLLERALAERIALQLAQTEFCTTSHYTKGNHEFARDVTVQSSASVIHILHLLLNNPKLFQAVQQITNCAAIGNFSGRIYRNLPDAGHHLDWHDDCNKTDRLVALSINLSTAPYAGGVFQLRYKGAAEMMCEVSHVGLGDAHLFRVDPALEHRLTEVTGREPRTAAAGWFRTQPDHITLLKSLTTTAKSGVEAAAERDRS